MLRKRIALLAPIALLACGDRNIRTITITLEGAGGRTAYFDRYENGAAYHVDSVTLDASGHGTLRVPRMPLDYYRIAVADEQFIAVLDSAESLTIEAQAGMLRAPKRAEGSVHTDALRRFEQEAQTFDAQTAALRQALSLDPANTANLDALNDANTAFYQRCQQLARELSHSPVAISVLSRLNMQPEFELFKLVRNDLRQPMGRSGFYRTFREQVDRYEQELVMQKLQEEEMKRLSNMLPLDSPAPEIEQPMPDGKPFALSRLRGQYVLIDFWASWCRPCRIENPNVKRVYERFRKKGFEILGVSLDRDHDAWVKAIQDDGLPWKHVSDLGFWNNAAAQAYGVSSIPFTVLVDREGRIIGKGLRGAELEARLAELLK